MPDAAPPTDYVAPMNRRVLLVGVAVAGVLAVGCAGLAVTLGLWATAPATIDAPVRGATLAAPPEPDRSVAVVPITVPLSELASTIESGLPSPLIEENGKEVREGVRMDLRATLDGHVTASGHEGRMVFRIPVSVDGRVYLGKRADRKKKDPEGVQFDADLVIEAAVEPTLGDDWNLRTRTRVTHAWRGTPTVTVAGLSFGVEALAEQAMTRADEQIGDKVDKRTRADDRVREKVNTLWKDLARPKKVKDLPPTWFVASPDALYATSPVVRSDSLKLTVGIGGRVALVLGDADRFEKAAPLPDRADPPSAPGFRLAVPVLIDWDALSARVTRAVADQRWTGSFGGAELSVAPGAVSLYPSGDRLVVSLALSVTAAGETWPGTAVFSARPVLDPAARVVSVEELTLAGVTWNQAVASTASAVAAEMIPTLQQDLRFEFGPAIDEARAEADTRLAEGLATDKATVAGTLQALAVQGVRLTDAGLVVDTLASGKVSMEATNLGAEGGPKTRIGR